MGALSLALLAQEPGSPTGWLDLISSGGVIGMFVLLSWLVATRRLVPGWTYRDMVEDRDRWRTIALQGLKVGEKAIDIAKEPQ